MYYINRQRRKLCLKELDIQKEVGMFHFFCLISLISNISNIYRHLPHSVPHTFLNDTHLLGVCHTCNSLNTC
uniref:Uncharacterized protein n=1 Tax=Octopus bimaculoides TaxID=37653 RepID=A0A0L8GIY0_OCTBM